MARFHEAPPQELIEKLAVELKASNKLKQPAWASYVKLGGYAERPPQREDWWYLRAAAILRRVALLGPIGTAKLQKKYGGLKRRGHKPAHFRRGSGSVIRKVLQQLQAAGYLTYKKEGVHKGRVATKEGVALLDKTTKQVLPKHEKKVKEVKQEAPQTEALKTDA